jgi:hypothetical protein
VEFYNCIKNFDLERQLLAPGIATHWSEGVLQEIWSSCVSNFTKGELSRAEDKLLAIAGLATRVHQRFPSVKYFAGLWGHDLEKQLLWRRKSGHTTYTRPDVYRAPSWSWASIDGEIELNWNKYSGRHGHNIDLRCAEPVAKVKEVSIEMVGKDPFGQVRAGTLRLLGNVWPGVEIGYNQGDKINGVDGLKGIMANPNLNHVATFPNSKEEIFVYLDSRVSLDQPWYLFPLFVESRWGMTGLLLQHAGQARGQFRRIGLFEIFRIRTDAPLLRPLLKALLEWDYEEKVGANEYIIHII